LSHLGSSFRNCRTFTASVRKHWIAGSLPERHRTNVVAPGYLCVPSSRAAFPIPCHPSSSGRSLCGSHWLKVRRQSNVLPASPCRTFASATQPPERSAKSLGHLFFLIAAAVTDEMVADQSLHQARFPTSVLPNNRA
jgi:hypothetical protein